jgi:hypothetical protein
MSDPTYIGVAADALREMAYIAAERAEELKQLSIAGTPADTDIVFLDEEVPF